MRQLVLAFGSLRRMMMRNFSFLGLSTSAVLLLALGGCNPAPVRLVDAHVPGDAGNSVDMGTGPGNDANVDAASGHDSGPTGACTYGGGCDLLDPSACPMPAGMPRQGCYPQTGAPACAPAGNGLAGATCSNLNDCDRGFVCLSTGTCSQLCCAATDCNPGETCSPLGDGSGNPLPNGVGFCYRPPSCTPVPNSGCPMATQQCVVISMDGTTDCQPIGTGAEGATCGGTSGVTCVEGTGCYGPAAGPDVCSRLCRIAMGNADCTGTATTCSNVGLGTTYGLCM